MGFFTVALNNGRGMLRNVQQFLLTKYWGGLLPCMVKKRKGFCSNGGFEEHENVVGMFEKKWGVSQNAAGILQSADPPNLRYPFSNESPVNE
jgi:hypothetical protein